MNEGFKIFLWKLEEKERGAVMGVHVPCLYCISFRILFTWMKHFQLNPTLNTQGGLVWLNSTNFRYESNSDLKSGSKFESSQQFWLHPATIFITSGDNFVSKKSINSQFESDLIRILALGWFNCITLPQTILLSRFASICLDVMFSHLHRGFVQVLLCMDFRHSIAIKYLNKKYCFQTL